MSIDETITELNSSVLSGAGPSVCYPLIDRLCESVLHGTDADREKAANVHMAARIPLLGIPLGKRLGRGRPISWSRD